MDAGRYGWGAIAVLAGIACGVSLILLRQAQRGDDLPGCGTGSGCAQITQSRWARFGPWPVSALGVLLYAFFGLVASYVALGGREALPSRIGSLLPCAAVLAVGGAVWFILLQILILHRFCLYCNLVHACGLLAGGLVFLGPRWRPVDPSVPASPFSPLSLWAGGTAVGALILGQLLLRPRLYRVTPLPEAPDATPVAATPPEVPGPTPCPTVPRQVALAGGRLRLSFDEWPLLGSAEAPEVGALFFDPTCQECRHMFRLLEQVAAQHPQRYAFLIVPIPLDPLCNPALLAPVSPPLAACEHTRLFWGLWLAEHRAWVEFTRWYLAPAQAPPLGEARKQAERLLGSVRLTLGLTDPRLEGHLRQAIDLFRSMNAPKLPQLFLPYRAIQGQVANVADIMPLLDPRPS